MKLAFAGFVTALFGTVVAAGQSSNQPQRSYGVAQVESMQSIGTDANVSAARPQTFTLCPASMRAQHVAGGNLVKTHSAQPSGLGQWLHLTLVPRDSKSISKATLTIRGYSSKGRLAQAESTHSESFDVVRSMTVPFTSGKDGSASADFLVPGMTAVGRIDLTSLNYADGSTWSIAADASCRVSPDLYMAVANR
jgi:hypothetical protein